MVILSTAVSSCCIVLVSTALSNHLLISDCCLIPPLQSNTHTHTHTHTHIYIHVIVFQRHFSILCQNFTVRLKNFQSGRPNRFVFRHMKKAINCSPFSGLATVRTTDLLHHLSPNTGMYNHSVFNNLCFAQKSLPNVRICQN